MFAPWELVKNRQFQERLSTEVNGALKGVRASSDEAFPTGDFETMPWLVAIVKESLRVHPVGVGVVRAPTRDDVVPL